MAVEVTDDGVLIAEREIAVAEVLVGKRVRVSDHRGATSARGGPTHAIVEIVTHVRWHVAGQPDLHASFPEPFQLHLEPIKLERTGLTAPIATSVDSLVRVVPKDRVETDDGERVGNDFNGKVGATLKDVVLFGGYEGSPDAAREGERPGGPFSTLMSRPQRSSSPTTELTRQTYW